ncbi:HD-GYP domain-containing protein [Clostridium bowmanii]|uniref:HD-GYP domain-containing protein n=1 Tax=Clostridium bowmanii TaxID=132925 RepID=UPI001C0BDF6A|nr:HD-GYP domain-containing protein [Clostridium bowmanii]MBU3190271.1 HD-GYP domain-containing protein [Clostridium bowmanii]MCA1072517.1 HD-GYP domain-containing protein [Clostridium bowmanii]
MRYIPIIYIREGMILGKTLYGDNGEVLLTKKALIRPSYIKKLIALGYCGLYIIDELSEDITVMEIINEDLKIKTIKSVKNLMQPNMKKKEIQTYLKIIEKSMGDIVDEILFNKDLMVNMIDLKVASEYTFYHSVNVCVLSIVLGVALKFEKKELYLLGLSALLHDMGKIYTPNEILDKPAKLTYEEFQIIKQHSENGYRYIKENLDIDTKVYMGIYQHHEKYDGTGYPLKLKGKKISLFARIITIADVYDALISDRPYRKGVLPSEGVELIMGSSGTLFDHRLVKIFSKKIAPYPIGTCVKLSNDLIGIVVENYSSYCLRPLIKIVKTGNKLVIPYLMNLKESNYNVTITAVSDALLY